MKERMIEILIMVSVLSVCGLMIVGMIHRNNEADKMNEIRREMVAEELGLSKKHVKIKSFLWRYYASTMKGDYNVDFKEEERWVMPNKPIELDSITKTEPSNDDE